MLPPSCAPDLMLTLRFLRVPPFSAAAFAATPRKLPQRLRTASGAMN
jgi:hypothetical protein